MKPVRLTHVTAVTALGDLDSTYKRLMNGETGIAPVDRFSTSEYPAHIAACIRDLSFSPSESMIQGILNKILSGIPGLPKDTLVITATTKGGIDILEQWCRGDQVDLAETFPSSISHAVSGKFGLMNSGFNISAACASSAIAVSQGAMLISSGRFEVVLVLCLDLVTEFVFSGFSALQILSPTPSKPFDRNRCGLSLGEGGAAILMMSEDRALHAGYPCMARIMGWGIAGDASHITAPARDGKGLASAIRRAIRKSGLNADDVSAIHAHGTGTIYNDEMELAAFQDALKNRGIPIHSIKGSIGHTLGAAGGIEIAVSVKSLQTETLPPTVGFEIPMESAQGRISSNSISLDGNVILTTNSGFGGINAAVILKKGENS
ncbi:MAG: beta-ketoacyl synthase N-terminal-like domain-containing protein [Thermodesulfobacteriota bacterium]